MEAHQPGTKVRQSIAGVDLGGAKETNNFSTWSSMGRRVMSMVTILTFFILLITPNRTIHEPPSRGFMRSYVGISRGSNELC